MICCVAACPPRFSVLVDKHSINGVENTGYTTAQSCQEHCVSVSNCVAVDFNFRTNTCWVHTDPADLDDINVYDAVNTNQYRIDRSCDTGTTQRSSTFLCFMTRVFFVSLNLHCLGHDIAATCMLKMPLNHNHPPIHP